MRNPEKPELAVKTTRSSWAVISSNHFTGEQLQGAQEASGLLFLIFFTIQYVN